MPVLITRRRPHAGHKHILQYLLDNNAMLGIRDRDGRTPQEAAAKYVLFVISSILCIMLARGYWRAHGQCGQCGQQFVSLNDPPCAACGMRHCPVSRVSCAYGEIIIVAVAIDTATTASSRS